MSGGWTWLADTDDHLTVAQESARAVIVFLYGFLLVRVAGRRVFGKWSALDITVSIVIGSNLSRTITGDAPLVATLAASTLLVALHWLTSRLVAIHPTLSRWIEGVPVDLVRRGEIDRKACRVHNVSAADLDEAVRQAGVESVGAADRMTLEPSGRLTLRPFSRADGDQSKDG